MLAAYISICSLAETQASGGDKSLLSVSAETSINVSPDSFLSTMRSSYPESAEAYSGKPGRDLSVVLWSPVLAPEGAKASLTLPESLKLGPKIELSLFRPKPTSDQEAASAAESAEHRMLKDMKMAFYWGSSQRVRADQPLMKTWDTLLPREKSFSLGYLGNPEGEGHKRFYRQGWTTGFWPPDGIKTLPDESAALTGGYSFRSSYSGELDAEVPAGLKFLAPMDLVAPDVSRTLDAKKALTVEWKPVPGAVAYYAQAVSFQEGGVVVWASSMSTNDAGKLVPKTEEEIRKALASGDLLSASQSSATIPAGIFRGAQMAWLSVYCYGPGFTKTVGSTTFSVSTTSTVSAFFKMGK